MDIFGLSISGVVYHNSGIFYERGQRRIGRITRVFVISNQAKRPIVKLHAVSDGTTWMIEPYRSDHDAVTEGQCVAGRKVANPVV